MWNIHALPKDELAVLLVSQSPKGEKQARYRARQIYRWVHQRQADGWDGMTDLAKDLRAWLVENVSFDRFAGCSEQISRDGTRKFLWTLGDGCTIESVIIPSEVADPGTDDVECAGGRVTACISSQVGCAMGCVYCMTGSQGIVRSLLTEEIVGQVSELRRLAPVTNVVFMGMGEPMLNYEAVVKACRILLDPDGMNFSKRRVTVSTGGVVPGIERLGKDIDVSLAVSLNATTDQQRDQLMPVNRKWNIASLLQACRSYPLGSHRRITFEYVLIGGLNDSLEDAARLERLLRGIPNKINLIAFNERAGCSYRRPTDESVRAFQKHLIDRRLTATLRASRGQDILAACGQLRSRQGGGD